nr:PREDICTED: ras-related protein Rab-44 isoform X1 [Lepisosteus oculatus]
MEIEMEISWTDLPQQENRGRTEDKDIEGTTLEKTVTKEELEEKVQDQKASGEADEVNEQKEEEGIKNERPLVKNEEDHPELLVEIKEEKHRSVFREKNETHQDEVKTPSAKENLRDDQEALGGQAGDILQEKYLTEEEEEGEGGRRKGLMEQETEQDGGVEYQREVEAVLKGEACKLDYGEDQNMELLQGRDSTVAEGSCDTAEEEDDRLDNQKTRLKEEELKGGTVRRREEKESENEEREEKIKNEELRGHEGRAAILRDVQGEEYNTDFKEQDLHNEDFHAEEGERVSESSKEEQMEASSLSAQILGTVVDISMWKPEAQKEVEEPLETQDKGETSTEQGVEDFNQGCEIPSLELEEVETLFGTRRTETRVFVLGTEGKVGETQDKEDENTNTGTEEQGQAKEIEDARSQKDGRGIAEVESQENNQLENEDLGVMQIEMEISRTDLPQQEDRGRTEDKDMGELTQEGMVTNKETDEKFQDQNGSEGGDEVHWRKEEDGIKHERPPLVKNEEDHAELLEEMKEEEHRSVFQEKEETHQDEVKAARAKEDLKDDQEALGGQAGDILQEKYLTEEEEEDKGERREGLMEQETEQDGGVVHQREVEAVLKGEACKLDYGEDQNMESLQGRDSTAAEGRCDTAEEEEDRLDNQKPRLEEEELKRGTVRRREERENENEGREEKIKNEELRGHEERTAILRDVQGEEYNTDFKEQDLHNEDFHAEEGERVSESSKKEQMEASSLSAQIPGTVVDISMWKPEAQKEVEEPLEAQDKGETSTEQGVEDFNQGCEIPSLELEEEETLFGTRRTETRVFVSGTEGEVGETEEKEDENTNKGAEEQGQAEEIEDVRSQKDVPGIAEGISQENNNQENEELGEMEIEMEISWTDLPQQENRGRTEDKDIEGTTLQRTVTKEEVEEKVQDQKVSGEADEVNEQNEEEEIKNERPPLLMNEEDHPDQLVEMKEEKHRSVFQEKEETHQDEVKAARAMEHLRDDQETLGGQAGDNLQEKYLTEEEEEGEGRRREGLMQQETEQDGGVVHQREVEAVLKGEGKEQGNHGDDTEHDGAPEHMAEEKSMEIMNSQDEDKILRESEIVSENQTNPGASGEEGKGEMKKEGETGGEGETTERRDRDTVLEVEGDIQVKDEMVSGKAEGKRVEQVDFVGEDGIATNKQAEEGRDEAKVKEVKQELRSTEEGKDGGSGKMRQVGEIKEALVPKAQVQGEEKQLDGAEESIGEEKMGKKCQEEGVKESIVITEEEEGASKCEDVIELIAEVDVFQANALLLEEEKKLREEVTQSKEQVVTGYHKVTGWMEMNQEVNVELEETEKEIKRDQEKGEDSEVAVREEEKPNTAGGEGGDKEIAEIEMKEVGGREIETQENRGRELAERAGEELHKREEETVVEEDRGMDLGVGCVGEKGQQFELRKEGLGEGVQEITQATVGSSDDWVGKAGEEQTQELEIIKENDEFQDPSVEPVIKQEAAKVRAKLLGTAQGIEQHAAGASVIGQNKGAISHMEQETQQGEEEKQLEGMMEKLLDQYSLRIHVRTLQQGEEMLREGVSPIDTMEDTEQEKRNAKYRYEEEEDDMLNEYMDEEQQQNGNQKEKEKERQEKLDLTVKSETDKPRLEDQHVVSLAQIEEAGSSAHYLQDDDYSRDEEIKGGLLKEEGLSDPVERKLDDTVEETGCEEIAMENDPTQKVKHPDVEEDILKEDETERERIRVEEREKNEKSKQKITGTQEQEKEQTEKDAGEETIVREEKWMSVREAGTEEDSEYKWEEDLKVKVTSQEKEEGRDLEKGQDGEEMGAEWVEQESQKKEPISGDECQRGEEEEGLGQNMLPEEVELKDRVQEQEEEMKTFVDKQDKVMDLLGDMHEYEQVTEGHEEDIKKEFEEIAEVMKGTNDVQTVKEWVIAEGETTSEKEENIRDENQGEKAGRTAVTVSLLQEEILRENGIEQKIVEQEFLDEASIRYSKEETENKVERETGWTEEQGKKVTKQKEQEMGEEENQEGKVRRDEWRESGLEKDKKSLAEKGREISAETGTVLELHWEKVKDGQEKKGELEEREESEHEEVKEKQELQGEVLTVEWTETGQEGEGYTVGGTEAGQEGEGKTVSLIETGQEVEFLTVSMTETGQEGEGHTVSGIETGQEGEGQDGEFLTVSMTETGQEGEVHTVGVIEPGQEGEVRTVSVIETGQEGEVHTVSVIETGQEREILTVGTPQTGQEGVVHTVSVIETGQEREILTVGTPQTGQEGVVHTVGGTEMGQGLDVIQEKDHKLSKEVKSAREDFIPTGLEEGEGRGGRKEVEITNVPVQGEEPWGQVKRGSVEERRGREGRLDTRGQGGAEGFGRQLLIPASDEPRGLACLPPGGWTPPLSGPERLYNVVMVGDSSVGKTCFLKRFQSGVFSADHCATIGMDSCIQKLTLDGRRIDLQLWDTAGQERYHSITKQFLRKASAVVVMYDIGSARSFATVRYWITCIQEGAADNVVILLLGNKSDNFTTREVPPQEGERLAREYSIQFLECSAASGYNVTSSMETLARMLSDREEQGQDDMVTLKEPPKKKSGCC